MSVNSKIILASTAQDEKLNTELKRIVTLECESNIDKLRAILPPYDIDVLEKFNKALVQWPHGLGSLLGEFIGYFDLETCSKIMPYLSISCKSDMAEKKQVTEEILPHIFYANPEGIDNFFKNPMLIQKYCSPNLFSVKAILAENSMTLTLFALDTGKMLALCRLLIFVEMVHF